MRLLIALAMLATAVPVAAQTAPPANPAPSQAAPPADRNIDARVRDQLRQPSERERVDALMTGDTDIILLRPSQLFTLTANVDITGTSNAALSPVNVRSDSFVQAQVAIAAGTRIGGKVDVFANAAVLGVRYFNERQLDYSAFSGVIGARTMVGPVAVTATYQPSIVFTRDFGARQLTSHRLRLGASLGVRFRGISIEPELHGERVLTDPGDFTAWSGGGSLTLSAPLSKKLPVFAYAQVGYDRRSFDNYFEAFVGTKRLDDNLSAGVGVVWRPRRWGEVRATYGFGRNWSTSDVNGFTAHSGTLGLSATLRF